MSSFSNGRIFDDGTDDSQPTGGGSDAAFRSVGMRCHGLCAAEDRIFVEAFEAAPIDVAVFSDARPAVAIADRGIVFDRKVVGLRSIVSAVMTKARIKGHAAVDEQGRTGDVIRRVGS